MKTLKYIFYSFVFLISVISQADEEFAGIYDGNEWGYFSWGDACTVEVKKNHNAYIISFPNHAILTAYQKSAAIDALVRDGATRKIHFKEGCRFSEGSKGGHLKIEEGKLSQVYLWDAYLILPSTNFSCGNLKKRL